MTPEEKKEKIAYHFGQIIETLGLDLNDPSIAKTPIRVASMYVDEVFSGLDPKTYPEVTFHEEIVGEELVLIKNITLMSFCEHHFVPMDGFAHVAYIPKKGVIGLSKIHRILRHFAKRPQLQERLTQEAAASLQEALQTEDVALMINMKHYCVLARGVEDAASELETHVLKGRFQSDPTVRAEFFSRVGKKEGRENKPDSVPHE